MIKRIFVILLLALVVVQLIAWPVYAYVGAVKVATDAALALAKKEAVEQAVAIAAAAGGGLVTRSLALRVVTSGIPWLGLGITLGTIAYQIYYSSADVNAVYTAAAGSAGWSNPSGGGSISTNVDNNKGFGAVQIQNQIGGSSFQICGAGNNQEFSARHVRQTAGTDETQQQWRNRMGYPVGSGWAWVQCGGPAAGYVYEYYAHNSSATYNSTDPYYSDGVASEADIENWFTANPSNSLNPSTRFDPVGVGGSAPTADDVKVIPLQVGDVVVTTKNVPVVGDVVLGDGFPPVGDVVNTDTQVTTRDTVVDPVTGQEEITESATSTCSGSSHDDRSLGNVLQTHVDTWQNT